MAQEKGVSSALSQDTLDKIAGFIEMSPGDIRFMEQMLCQQRVAKALEVGVSAGGGSALMLSLLARQTGAQLYAVDHKDYYYRDRSRPAGFLVAERFTELMDNYHLFTGADVAFFIEQIGGGIDLALVDTSHTHPVETLNVLTILPYMRSDAWIVLHDIRMFLKPSYHSYATKYIFDAWRGERRESTFFSESIGAPNIAALKVELLEENKRQLLSVLFNRWDKDVPDDDLAQVRSIMAQHYGDDDLQTFDRAVSYNRAYLEHSGSVRRHLRRIRRLLRERLRAS